MADGKSTRRIPGLDVIRGIAIALVMLRHAWPDTFGSGGVVGVVAFFALSGYLITGLLTSDIRRFGHVRYGRFYRNRILRLFPPLLAMLMGVVLVALVWNPLHDRGGIWRVLLSGITYTGDIPYDHGSPAIGHLWTLATEEQFYIVWPLLLTLAIRWRRVGLIVAGSALVVLLALAGTIWVAAPDVERIYPLPSSWAIAMIIGAAARVWEDRLRALMPARRTARAWLGAVAASVLVALAFIPESKASPWSYFVLGPSVAVIAVVLIFAWSESARLPSRLLTPLLALGTISYAAYLWNYPIVMWLGGQPLRAPAAAASIVLTVMAAALSWLLVEKPVQRWRGRLDRRSHDQETRRSGIVADRQP